MKLTTVIVDDEPLGQQALQDLCAQQPDVDVVGVCNGGMEAIKMVRELEPALLLLDVQMKPLSGIQVATELAASPHTKIVFATAFDRFAVRAFELNALDYLLKPVEPQRFGRMLDKMRSTHRQTLLAEQQQALRSLGENPVFKQPARLLIETAGRAVFVDTNNIDCIEAQGNYVALQVGDMVHTVRSTLTDFEQRLPSAKFLRLHRSLVVNIERIKSMERTFCGEFDIELENRRRFRTGRTYRRHIQEFLLRAKADRSC